MLMNTTFLGDSFSIKWQSREEASPPHPLKILVPTIIVIRTASIFLYFIMFLLY